MMNTMNRVKTEVFINRSLSGQPSDHCSPRPAWHSHRSHCYEGHFTEKKWKGIHCRKFRVRTSASFSRRRIMLLWATSTVHLVQCNMASAAPSWTTWMRRPGAWPLVLCQKSWMTASWEATHTREGQVRGWMRLHDAVCVIFVQNDCHTLLNNSSWLACILHSKIHICPHALQFQWQFIGKVYILNEYFLIF